MKALPSFRSGLAASLTALCASFPLISTAQGVSTVPVGAMVYSFPVTTQVTSTFISVPLTNASVYTGPVSSLTTNTITFSGTPFTSGSLAQAGSPFFARIASGPQAGRAMLITANTANSITLDTTDNSSQTTGLDASGWSLAAGNRVEIIVGDTIASLFGINTVGDPLLFVGASSVLSADTVSIYNKTTSRPTAYFFSTTLGFWRSSTTSINANSVVIYPETGLTVTRREDRPAVSLTLIGDVPSVAPLTKVTGNDTIVRVSTRYPADMTLASLNSMGLTRSNSIISADTISIFNPTTSRSDSYFRRLDVDEWRRSGGGTVNQNSFALPAGSVITILKRDVVTGAQSYLASTMPYTL